VGAEGTAAAIMAATVTMGMATTAMAVTAAITAMVAMAELIGRTSALESGLVDITRVIMVIMGTPPIATLFTAMLTLPLFMLNQRLLTMQLSLMPQRHRRPRALGQLRPALSIPNQRSHLLCKRFTAQHH